MSANKDLPIRITAANFDELLAAVAKIKAFSKQAVSRLPGRNWKAKLN